MGPFWSAEYETMALVFVPESQTCERTAILE